MTIKLSLLNSKDVADVKEHNCASCEKTPNSVHEFKLKFLINFTTNLLNLKLNLK